MVSICIVCILLYDGNKQAVTKEQWQMINLIFHPIEQNCLLWTPWLKGRLRYFEH